MFEYNNWYEYVSVKAITHFTTYSIAAGSLFLIFWVLFKKKWIHLKIQPAFPKSAIIKKEMKWSFLNIFTLAITSLSIYFLYKYELTKLYSGFDRYGWGYFFVSVPILMILQDAYFYWTHRTLHTNFFYKKIHKVHHQFTNPSPWASLAQHPFEIIPQNIFVIVIICVMPLHKVSLIVFIFISSGINLLGHLGYEIFPKWFLKSWLTKVFLTSTFHNMHHEYYTKNYGLYFMFWDKIMGTAHVNYHKRITSIKEIDEN